MNRSTLVEQAVLATEKAKEYVSTATGVISKARSLVAGDALFFATAPNINDLRRGLAADSLFDKCDAMKKIVAQMCKGADMHVLFPDVVKNIHAPSIEMRKLVYLFVVQYAEQCPHEALLSVSAFQKDLTDTSMHVRSLALRMLSGIRIPAIHPVVMVAIRRCADDSAALVRKTAALALLQVHSVNSTETNPHEVIEILRKLLADRHPDVLGAAVTTFEEICPDAYELIHPLYRSICKKLVDCAEWDQTNILRMLLRYARHEFNNPEFPLTHTEQQQQQEEETLVDKKKANDAAPLEAPGVTPTISNDVNNKMNKSSSNNSSNNIANDTERKLQGNSTKNKSSNIDTDNHSTTSSSSSSTSSSSSNKATDNKVKKLEAKQKGVMNRNTTNSNNKTFDVEETMSSDHILLLQSARPLLRSLNSAVVAGVVALYFHCAPPRYLDYCVPPLIRLLRSCKNGQSVILSLIKGVMSKRKSVFVPYIEEFYILPHDSSDVRQRKLSILALLISEDNFDRIFQEFKNYVRSYSIDCVVEALHTLALIITTHSEFASHVVRLLTPLLSHPHPRVITEAIHVLRLLVIQGKHSTLTARLIFRLLQQAMNNTVQSPAALSAILWLVGENIRLHAAIASAAPDCFRVFASKFVTLDSVVKSHVLTLGCKIWLHLSSSGAMATRFKQMYEYVIELAKYDNDYKIREYARLLEPSLNKEGEVFAALKEILLSSKAAPEVVHQTEEVGDFEIGTCSYFFQHTFSVYDKLPPWSEEPVDDTRRHVAGTSPISSLTSPNTILPHSHLDLDSTSSESESAASSSSEEDDYYRSDTDSTTTSSASSSSSSSFSEQEEEEEEQSQEEEETNEQSESEEKSHDLDSRSTSSSISTSEIRSNLSSQESSTHEIKHSKNDNDNIDKENKESSNKANEEKQQQQQEEEEQQEQSNLLSNEFTHSAKPSKTSHTSEQKLTTTELPLSISAEQNILENNNEKTEQKDVDDTEHIEVKTLKNNETDEDLEKHHHELQHDNHDKIAENKPNAMSNEITPRANVADIKQAENKDVKNAKGFDVADH